jgi:hypothetical protein
MSPNGESTRKGAADAEASFLYTANERRPVVYQIENVRRTWR